MELPSEHRPPAKDQSTAASTCASGHDRNNAPNTVCPSSTLHRREDDDIRDPITHLRKIQQCLYRAGDILQAIFYAYREAVFEMPISRVEKNEAEKIHIFTNYYGDDGDDFIHYLPRSYISNFADRRAVLSYDACGEAPGHMFELTKKLLDGLDVSITEIQVRLKQEQWAVVRHFTDGGPEHKGAFKHELTIVKTAQGDEYVFDLAGAQYNQHSAVLPYNDYKKCFKPEVIIKDAAFGLRNASLQADLEGRNDDNLDDEYDMRVDQIQAQVVRRLNAAVQKWEKKYGKTLQGLLDEPDDQYEKHKTSLLTKIADAIRMYMLEWKMRGYKLEPRGSRLCYTDKSTPVAASGSVTPEKQTSSKADGSGAGEWGDIDEGDDDGDSEGTDESENDYDDTPYGTGTQYGWL